MNQSTPITVATGTIASSVTGALITGTYALAKRRGQVVASIYATSAALNCGVAGATFFSIRGYVIVPLLTQVLPSRLHEQRGVRKTQASPEPLPNGAVTLGAMRLHHTLDSALSGGITGAVLNAWKRGARGTYPGMMFGSAFCALGQFLHNELDVQRIKYVSQRLLSSSSRLPSPSLSGFTELKRPSFDRLIDVIGLKWLPDEEYLARLREERATCLQRIAELEARAEFDKDSKHHPST